MRGLKDELENLPGPETFQVLHEVFIVFPYSRVNGTSCQFFFAYVNSVFINEICERGKEGDHSPHTVARHAHNPVLNHV